MNKYRLISTCLLLGAMLGNQAMAAFTLSGTRFIYEEGRKNISIEVNNKSQETYGGQVWVDNIQHSAENVYFTPAPTFFRVDGNQKQIIRLLNINQSLPKDKESIFWLNVQEIPPVYKDGANVLAVALNTKVKLFFRPKALVEKRENAEQQIQVKGNELVNPTPYYFAITNVQINGQPIKLSKQLASELSIFPPFSQVKMGRALNGAVKIEAIDDYGARREYQLK